MKITSAQIQKFGTPLQVKHIFLPPPKHHEVQVKIHFAGINYYERMFLDGNYPTKVSLPLTLGGELSGEVIKTGSEVKEFRKGDRIFSLAQTGIGTTGSYATYANIDKEYVYALPTSFTFEQGAAFPMVFFTAYTMLTKKVSVGKNSNILVHSGSGGVGGALIQLITALYPSSTIVSTTSDPQKVNLIKQIGAKYVIQSSTKNLVSEIQQYVPDGLDIIFDPVGQSLFESHLTLLKPLTGIMCSYGTYSGAIQDPKAIGKIRAKNLTLAGFLMWPLLENKAWCSEVFNEIFTVMNKYSITPRIDTIFPLMKVNEAISYIKNRKNTGKVLLQPHSE